MNLDHQLDSAAEKLVCQQILVADQSVFSVQRLLLPEGCGQRITSAELLGYYLAYVERFTLGIIRAVTSEHGIEFRLGRQGPALIRFAPPLATGEGDNEATVLRICGGLLVQPRECDRGELEFRVEQTEAGCRLTLQLADFCPLLLGSNRPSRLHKLLYRLTQAYIHKVVTVRFLRLVYRQLTGRKLAEKAVRIEVRKGEEI